MHQLSETGRKEIEKKIRDILVRKSEISFAFAHGSFVKEDHFRDIDIAIFLDQIPEHLLDYELSQFVDVWRLDKGDHIHRAGDGMALLDPAQLRELLGHIERFSLGAFNKNICGNSHSFTPSHFHELVKRHWRLLSQPQYNYID